MGLVKQGILVIGNNATQLPIATLTNILNSNDANPQFNYWKLFNIVGKTNFTNIYRSQFKHPIKTSCGYGTV